MIKLSPKPNLVAQEHQPSKAAVVAKFLLVAVVIAGLVAATVFSGGAAAALIAAGAASWKIGLVLVGCIASAITTLGAVYFAAQNDMFKDTGRNWEDAGSYLLNTLGTGLYVGAAGIDLVRDIEIWKLIIKQ